MKKTFFILFGLSLSPLSLGAPEALNVIPNAVPKEFRTLWAGQDEIVEVYFYGSSLGMFRIQSMPDSIRFYEPIKIVDKLNVKPEIREKVQRLLSTPLSRNGNLSCPKGTLDNEKGCGFIRTDGAAVIFNENDETLNLFVNRNFLLSTANNENQFRETTEGDNAFIHSQSLNVSDNRQYQSLFASGIGTLGITQDSYVTADWQFSYLRNKGKQNDTMDLRDTSIRNIYYRYDIARRYYIQSGRMDSTELFKNSGGNFSFSLLPVPSIDGMRIGTTQSYLRPRNSATATPVTVLLSHFSRIEAYRDNQLIGTFYLDSGIKELDTQMFPEGSYTLDLRFFEGNHLVRTERLPFSKWNGLTGSSLWNFFLQGGKINSETSTTAMKKNKDLLLTGIRFPLGNSSIFQQGIAFLSNKQYAESSLDWGGAIWDGSFNARIAWLWGSDNVTGNSENISYNDGFSLSFYHQQQRGSVYNSERSDYLNWTGNNETYSVLFSVPLFSWQTSLGYNYNINNSNVYSYCYNNCDQYNPVWQIYHGKSRTWQINISRSFLWDKWSLMPSLGIHNSHQETSFTSQTDRGIYFTLTMSRNDTIAHSSQRNITAGYSMNHSSTGGSQNNIYVASQWVRDTDLQHQELETRINGRDDNYEGMIRARMNNRFGDLNGSLSVSRNKSFGNDRSFTLLYDSSLALNHQGLTWGGNASGIENLAGDIITVDAEPQGIPLVQIRGEQTLALDGGQRSLIPVTALTETELNLNEIVTGQMNVHLSQTQNRKQFLVPGHVYSHTIKARTSWTYTGRALDSLGKPLSNAAVLNIGSVRLDSDGGFSFEHDRKDNAIYVLKDKMIYRCPVKATPRNDALIFLGTMICEKSSENNLPSYITHVTTDDEGTTAGRQ
ncbi:TcfC E-set like domain-containing protein [Escherichia coli]|uniref:TcfC E-set like domain-containing protein n=1 Tax=Escherichia coli TaxID=562 RepID=UPI001F24DFF3|nr:TcfC E-set like domain-containing protein [Escherichia coli]MCF2182815.1 TcfC E-set like domain-containing protein [Escherichia coli]